MLFNSFEFLVFFPTVVLLCNRLRHRLHQASLLCWPAANQHMMKRNTQGLLSDTELISFPSAS